MSSMPQGPRDAAVDAWINTRYHLADGPVNARYAALSVQLRGQVTHYMAAIGAADAESLSHYVAVGELSLDGRIAASPAP